MYAYYSYYCYRPRAVGPGDLELLRPQYGKTIKHAVDYMDGKYRETIACLSCATSTVRTDPDRRPDVFFEGAANETPRVSRIENLSVWCATIVCEIDCIRFVLFAWSCLIYLLTNSFGRHPNSAEFRTRRLRSHLSLPPRNNPVSYVHEGFERKPPTTAAYTKTLICEIYASAITKLGFGSWQCARTAAPRGRPPGEIWSSRIFTGRTAFAGGRAGNSH